MTLYSLWFLIGFFPLSIVGYFFLNHKKKFIWARVWLLGFSLLFYGLWDFRHLPLLACSILFNFSVARYLAHSTQLKKNRLILTLGVIANVLALAFFKYTPFLLENFNLLFQTNLSFFKIFLPLGISFYTFQQITFLVATYRGKCPSPNFIDYALFISFYPQVSVGPILSPEEVIPTLKDLSAKEIIPQHVIQGLFRFSVGLFKKIVLADTLALWGTIGIKTLHTPSFFEAHATALACVLQYYFDFSGYIDMAIGVALLFNIRLPENFDSPYRAVSIQEYWRKWHITLGRFMGRHIYIPLGGNKKGRFRTCINLMIVFIIGGIWHGPSWTFVIWGALNGLGIIVHRLWQYLRISITRPLAWALTFSFVILCRIVFCVKTWHQGLDIVKGLIGLNGFVLPSLTKPILGFLSPLGVRFGTLPLMGLSTPSKTVEIAVVLIAGFFIALATKNSAYWEKRVQLNTTFCIIIGLMLFSSLQLILFAHQATERFVYAAF